LTQNRRPIQTGGNPQARQTQPARPAQAAKNAQSRLPYDFWPLVIACAVVLTVAVLMQAFWPVSMANSSSVQAASSVTEIHSAGPVRINELMASNSATLVDENGVTSDWLEIVNTGSAAVSLESYALGKTKDSSSVFRFPTHTLQPGECMIVYCDSTLRSEPGQKYHAPFRLSSQGGTLMLFAPSGTVIDSVNFPAMVSDSSYARVDNSHWTVSGMPTPGMANTDEGYRALHAVVAGAGVEITEVVASNAKYAPDENGAFHDYFELHNTTGEPIDLSGWFVSDVMGQPTKWRVPDGVTLQPGEYRVIYASGLDRADAAYLHTSFGLSSEGEAVVLANPEGKVADCVEFDLLKTNQAWVRQADNTWTTGTPTPNAENG